MRISSRPIETTILRGQAPTPTIGGEQPFSTKNATPNSFIVPRSRDADKILGSVGSGNSTPTKWVMDTMLFFSDYTPYGRQTILWRITSEPTFKRSNILKPAMNLAVGDTMPKPDGQWSSSLWWPTSGMGRGDQKEGIDNNRHQGTGIAVFNDGHSEARKDAEINPPSDPIRTSTAVNMEYWDPLQRTNKRAR